MFFRPATLSPIPAMALALLPCLACGDTADLAGSWVYRCQRAIGRVCIDGKLDEAAWSRAERLDRFVAPPVMDWDRMALSAPRPATSRTQAWLLWSEGFLYLGLKLSDLDLYGISQGHDPAFASEDVAELFVKPRADQPSYWEFHVTPTGATRDYFYARRGAGADARWLVYESGMQAAVTLRGTLNRWEDRDDGWTVEAAIPMAAFAKCRARPEAGARWSFMVSRYDYSVHLERGCELSAAAPLPRENFHLYEHYAALELVE